MGLSDPHLIGEGTVSCIMRLENPNPPAPKKSMAYSNSLPYECESLDEAELLLDEILGYLIATLRQKDYVPGVDTWLSYLRRWFDLKYPLSLNKRIAILDLMIEIVLMPGAADHITDSAASMASTLLKNKKAITPEDIVIDWKPLYEAVVLKLKVKKKAGAFNVVNPSDIDLSAIEAYLGLIDELRRFYSPQSPFEILEKVIPEFYISHGSFVEAMIVQRMIMGFVPTRPEGNPREWLPTIFSLWSIIVNLSIWDFFWMNFIGDIALQCVIEDSSSPTGVFTMQQMDFIFTTGLRIMDLPVGSSSKSSSTSDQSPFGSTLPRSDTFRSFASFIVYTMFPTEEENKNGGISSNSISLQHLAKLIQAIETYFNPSNRGHWTYPLARFLQCLTYFFLRRWRKEQEPDCKTPVHRRLTPQLRKEFVLTIRNVAFVGMFSKDPSAVNTCNMALKYMSILEPSLIFPGLLERVYPALESVIESHRTTSCIDALALMADPLISREIYPAGAKHIPQLLHLVLPGIDLNDAQKAMSSLVFIANTAMIIKIGQVTGEDDAEWTPPENSDDGELSLEEENMLTRSALAAMEGWVPKYFGRVFSILENLPEEHRGKNSSRNVENSLLNVLHLSTELVCMALSDELYDMALKLVTEYVTNNISANSLKIIGSIVFATSRANQEKALKSLLHISLAEIKSELENGASSTKTTSTAVPIASDTTLHWYQSVLHGLLSNGEHFVKYRNELLDILKLMTERCKSERGYAWNGRIIKQCLLLLTATYPTEWRSVDRETWNSEDFRKNHYLYWGKLADPKDLKIDWHRPNDAEIQMALDIIRQVGVPALEGIENLVALKSSNTSTATDSSTGRTSTPPNLDRKVWSNDFCRFATVVKSIIGSISSFVYIPPVPTGDSPFILTSDDPHGMKRLPPIKAGYILNDPNDERYMEIIEFRDRFGRVLHKCVEHLRGSQEDNVDSLKMTIKCIRLFLTELGCDKSKYDNTIRAYIYGRDLHRTVHDKKKLPRHLLIRRAQLYHFKRLRINSTDRKMRDIERSLILDLTDLSLSTYTQIRISAQSAIEAARTFMGITQLTAPILLDALKPAETGTESNPDRMKGALYLLRDQSFRSAMTWDWRYVRTYVTRIVRAQHEEKPSIQELVKRKAYEKYVSSLPEMTTPTFENPSYLDAISRLESLLNLEKRISSEQEQMIGKDVVRRQELKNDECNALQNELLEVVMSPSTHWRYKSMASTFLSAFERLENGLNSRVGEYFLKASVSEMPMIRRSGMWGVDFYMRILKVRSIAPSIKEIITDSYRHPLKRRIPVNASSDFTSQFVNSFTDSNSMDDLTDDRSTGWLAWGEDREVCSLPPNGHRNFEVEESSKETYEAMKRIIIQREYWITLIGYMTLDTSSSYADRFNANDLSTLIKRLGSVYEDEFLDALRPEVEILCDSTEDKNKQRTAAEIIAGIVRSSRHWNREKLTGMWDWIIPLLKKSLLASNPESVNYWVSALENMMRKRDPRRLRPLLDLLLSFKLDITSHAAFAEMKKLKFINHALTVFSWHFEAFIDPLIETYFANVSLPYSQVRDILGSNLSEAFDLKWHPSFPSAKAYIQWCSAQGDGVGMAPRYQSKFLEQKVEEFVQLLDGWYKEKKPTSEGPCDYFNGGKTIVVWLFSSYARYRVSSRYSLIIPFLPELFRMQDVHDELELVQFARAVTMTIERLDLIPDILAPLFDKLINIVANTDSWHVKWNVMPMIQLVFYRHLFLLKKDTVIKIMDVVFGLLTDSKVEVRKVAAETLSGLIRCSQREAIVSVRSRSSKMLSMAIPQRVKGSVTLPEGYSEALLKRHAGALGLSCIINAFPYEIPDWMPSLMIELAQHIADPVPIQTTVRDTFANFRRTHIDTWAEDQKRFTEDQLSILMDVLISPNYYA